MRTFGEAVLTFESEAEILWHLYATSDLWFHVAKRNDMALGKRVAKSGFVRSTHDCCGLDLLLKEVKNVNMTSLEVPKKLFNTKFNKKKTHKNLPNVF